MPSPHRRIGLVVDDDMGSALAVLREQHGAAPPETVLARNAMFGGVALEAVLREATSTSPSRDAARELLSELRRLLDIVVLPAPVRGNVVESIEQVARDSGLADRRRRQLALLESPSSHGRAALAQTELIDAFDPQPD